MGQGNRMSVPSNCALSSRYVAWMERDTLFRASFRPDVGIFTQDKGNLRGGGRVVAVGEGGTVVIATGDGVAVWDVTGKIQRLRLKGMAVSIVPRIASFEGAECVEASGEYVVFHRTYRWKVSEDHRIIRDSIDSPEKMVFSGDRSFSVRIRLLDFAPNGWVGAIGRVVGPAYPEYDVVVGKTIFRQPVSRIFSFPAGISVIAGYRGYHTLWGPEGKLPSSLAQWKEGGEAHEVVWNGQWTIQLLRGPEIASLTWFCWETVPMCCEGDNEPDSFISNQCGV